MSKSFFLVLLMTSLVCCHKENDVHLLANEQCIEPTEKQANYYGRGALLASRFKSMEELQSIVSIEWYKDGDLSDDAHLDNNMVRLKHCSEGLAVISTLKSGISQNDIMQAKDGVFSEKLALVFNAPKAIRNRRELKQVYILSRRFSDIFSVEDVAFYYLAEAAVNKITNTEKAFLIDEDSGEKGYINTFNHITAQAMITSIFSEEFADFIADVHELKNMPELTSGVFSEKQLNDPNINPIDNYIDMINNEWGQKLGLRLKEKYNINRNTIWTPDLLADYLNELQAYYSWAFQIDMNPFRPDDGVIVRFKDKINRALERDDLI